MPKPILICKIPCSFGYESSKRNAERLNDQLGDDYHIIPIEHSCSDLELEVLQETKLSSKKFQRAKKLIKLSNLKIEK